MRGFICALWLLISAAHAGTAAEQPVIVDVQREAGNVYRFSMQFVANAAPESVFAVITNYNQLTELNPLIKSSRLLPSNSPGVDRVELITEGCLLFFCKKIRRVELHSFYAAGFLVATLCGALRTQKTDTIPASVHCTQDQFHTRIECKLSHHLPNES